MKQEGYENRQIAALANVSERTVRRLLRADPDCLCVDGTDTRVSRSSLEPYKERVSALLSQGFKPSQILRKLQAEYPCRTFKRTTLNDFCCALREDATGCRAIKGAAARLTPETSRKVKRRKLVGEIWSGGGKIPAPDMAYITENFPAFVEIKTIVSEFRTAYSQKDADAINLWIDRYANCRFPGIQSFIKGIYADEDAFFNSIKYEYSNGLLEGSVNKLKTVKRSMFGRARYALLRAKVLLLNH